MQSLFDEALALMLFQVKPQVLHGHLILSDGPGFIGGNNRSRAQSLQTFQLLYVNVFASQSPSYYN